MEDVILINWNSGEVFAKARIISVKETTFSELSEDDKQGHEKFSSDEEMYKEYAKFYNQEVSGSIPLKIIWFKLI